MYSDRELLELAAKAAGISKQWDGSLVDNLNPSKVWNPLTDDGDALRLAVKLGIEFHMEGDEESECVWANEIFEWTDGDSIATTRRAIVRAAAAIGEAMQ